MIFLSVDCCCFLLFSSCPFVVLDRHREVVGFEFHDVTFVPCRFFRVMAIRFSSVVFISSGLLVVTYIYILHSFNHNQTIQNVFVMLVFILLMSSEYQIQKGVLKLNDWVEVQIMICCLSFSYKKKKLYIFVCRIDFV